MTNCDDNDEAQKKSMMSIDSPLEILFFFPLSFNLMHPAIEIMIFHKDSCPPRCQDKPIYIP